MLKFFCRSLCHSASSLLVSAAPTSVPLLFSYLTLALSSPLYPLVLSGFNWSLDTNFSRETTRVMSWPNGERYLRPLQFFVVSLLLSRIHFCLFSDWGRTVSSKFFDTQVPSISIGELVLPRYAC